MADASSDGTGGTTSGTRPAATIASVYARLTGTRVAPLTCSEVAVIATMPDCAALLDDDMFVHYRKPRGAGFAAAGFRYEWPPDALRQFRKSLEDLMSRATPPDDRREI